MTHHADDELGDGHGVARGAEPDEAGRDGAAVGRGLQRVLRVLRRERALAVAVDALPGRAGLGESVIHKVNALY